MKGILSLFLTAALTTGQTTADPESTPYCSRFIGWSEEKDNAYCEDACSVLEDDGTDRDDIRKALQDDCLYQHWSVVDGKVKPDSCFNTYVWQYDTTAEYDADYDYSPQGPAECQASCQSLEDCVSWVFSLDYIECYRYTLDRALDRTAPKGTGYNTDSLCKDGATCLVCNGQQTDSIDEPLSHVAGDRWCTSPVDWCNVKGSINPPGQNPFPPYHCDRCDAKDGDDGDDGDDAQ